MLPKNENIFNLTNQDKLTYINEESEFTLREDNEYKQNLALNNLIKPIYNNYKTVLKINVKNKKQNDKIKNQSNLRNYSYRGIIAPEEEDNSKTVYF